MWVLSVEDDGPGIPTDLVAGIFASGSSARGAHRGTGLAPALQAVRRMGGQLVLEESRPGLTAFHIRLPAAEPPER